MQGRRKWSAPKKNNDRAWKRIEKGDWLWDHRRVRRGWRNRKFNDTTTKYDYVKEEVMVDGDEWWEPHVVYRLQRVPGSGREVPNYDRKPHEVDLGG